jgi:hypothetical protein
VSDLFRRDREVGVSPPNLADSSSFAEHIVHRRGKRTRFTSVSADPMRIRDFGEQLWKLVQPKVWDDGHVHVSHDDLLGALRAELQGGDEDAKEIAARALPRAVARREALVDWRFDTDGVERKDLIAWALARVRPLFVRG